MLDLLVGRLVLHVKVFWVKNKYLTNHGTKCSIICYFLIKKSLFM
ncbi:hypothetical protein [Sulfurospirillum arcachonense]